MGADADLCRVTVIAPRSRMDLALPNTVALADLLPPILRSAGDGVADEGLAHGGWAVQRLGEAPLDTGQSTTQLGLRDGDVLYLRPRRDQLPEAAFDDVVDAIATALSDRGDRWRSAAARVTALVVGALMLLCGVVVTTLSGPQWTFPAVAAGLVAIGAVVAGGAVSRGLGDGVVGTVLGAAAVPFGFLAGLFGAGLLSGLGDKDFGQLLTPPDVVAGFAAALVFAVVAGVLVAAVASVFVVAALIAVFGVLGGLVALAGPPAGAAAVVVALALALTPQAPMAAYRIAALPMPFVPAGAQDMRRDEQPLPGAEALAKAVVADRVLTALVAGSSIVAAAGAVLIARGDGLTAPALSALVALLLALRSRLFTGRAQRLWLLGAAVVGLVVSALRLTGDLGRPLSLVAVLVPLLALAGIVLATAMRTTDRRRGPFLGRLADIVELIGIIGVVPLALGLLGVYGYVVALWG